VRTASRVQHGSIGVSCFGRPNPDKSRVLAQLRADLAQFDATSARELAERRLGRPVSRSERLARGVKT